MFWRYLWICRQKIKRRKPQAELRFRRPIPNKTINWIQNEDVSGLMLLRRWTLFANLLMKNNFQRWTTWFPQRWRTQRNAIRNANCRSSESSNLWTQVAPLVIKACLFECRFIISIYWRMGLSLCSGLKFNTWCLMNFNHLSKIRPQIR